MPFTTTADAQALDALNSTFGSFTPVIAWASLHYAYSSTGANELSGGSPAYGRVSLTWAAASTGAGTKALSTTPGAFNVPGFNTVVAGQNTPVAFIGLWSAQTNGTFAGMGPNGGFSPYAFTATSASPCVFTAPGTSYTAGQSVVLLPAAGSGAIPTGFTAGTIYYVSAPSGATFSLAATNGGTAINSSSTGSGLVQAIAVESYAVQGTFQLNSETLQIQ